ncbi:unnamed protein product [Malassezia sympodialis ATCC 42132]|uniref:uncharacterized protein n=1 Tax=Malassezia sympodialis (strain ATCC 42132) TaxID=1230383 RepID=UPI0002C21B01|nr:uncharacterized protein MSY001_1210 [Malassezia sympodialis ATCC 42132]CCU98504.1 unnamed protein product [Malassezia sympodialis ATCC 42132]|eukprot:XP_018739808.1 uncharacterized protein MSY001_1210 [Malassezia sympodialis ATCC 42132]
MDARTRAPPPGSPAATYRALVKEAMRPRQKRIYVLAWIITYAALVATLAPAAPLRSFVVLSSVAVLATTVVPLLLFRRTHLIRAVPPRTLPCVSRASLVAHLLRADDAWHAVALHAACGALVAMQCAVLQVCLRGWSAPLSPMRYIDAHHAYYVNEAFLSAVSLGTTVGAAYAVAYMLLVPGGRRGVPPFSPTALGTSLRTRCLGALPRHVLRALMLLVAVPLLLLAYSLARDTWWAAVLRVVGVETSVRRFLVPSFRVPYAPGALGLHALPVITFLLVLFEATHTLFDVYWTQPLCAIPPRLNDPLTALLGGLHDPHPFFSAHALAELAHWAQSEPARRHALFEDAGAAPAAPPTAPTPAALSRASALWRTLGYVVSSLWARMPSEAQHVLFPQTLYSALVAPAPALWLDAHLLDDRARACWAAQVLQHLVLASLAEDKYGSVQPHVPALVPALAQAHERLMAVRRRAEDMAVEADTHLVREAQLVRRALAAAGADANAATFPPAHGRRMRAWTTK